MKRTTKIAKHSLVVATVLTLVSVLYYFDSTKTEGTDVQVECVDKAHDWECKFIIVESYNGKEVEHYIDEYNRNEDHSITFIGNDGLVTTIPFPYFRIIVNPKK